MTNINLNTMSATAAKISHSTFSEVVNDCKSIIYKTSKSLKTKTKRAFALLLMLFMLAPLAARAQSTFGGGSGTETDPYIIATTDDMDELASNVNGGNEYSGTYFLMTADLDYSGKSYTPVGNSYNPFRGVFDGDGHTISNITLSGVSDQGVFARVSWGGLVENLTLDQSSIGYRGYRLGGIAGGVEGATIRNCINKASITANDYQYDGHNIGGIAGYATNSSIIDCQNYGAVNGCYFVGGIVGSTGSNTVISGCQNHGRVNYNGGYLSEYI